MASRRRAKIWISARGARFHCIPSHSALSSSALATTMPSLVAQRGRLKRATGSCNHHPPPCRRDSSSFLASVLHPRGRRRLPSRATVTPLRPAQTIISVQDCGTFCVRLPPSTSPPITQYQLQTCNEAKSVSTAYVLEERCSPRLGRNLYKLVTTPCRNRRVPEHTSHPRIESVSRSRIPTTHLIMSPPAVRFFLHIPSTPQSGTPDTHRYPLPVSVRHLVLTVDTPKAELTMRLPIGRAQPAPPRACWDDWIARIQRSFLRKFGATPFDRRVLLDLAGIYRAFTVGRHARVNLKSSFYDDFTNDLVELARAAVGRCVKRELAFYLSDMCVLIPDANVEPVSEVSRDHPIASPPSPSISAAADLAHVSAYDSGYDSCDSMPSLRTVTDSSDEYMSDSSEEPDSDEEEEAMIRRGFVVYEDDADMSDLNL